MATRKKSASPSQNRDKAIQDALAEISKAHGEEAVMDMSKKDIGPIQGISSGSLSLDQALGGKGLPRGRVIELYGPESSGKSTLAMSVVAQAQKAGGFGVFIDAEHAFDPEYATNLGIDLSGDKFLLSQPSSGEEGLDICERFVKSNAVDVVVIDSVAALVPNAELRAKSAIPLSACKLG